MSVRKPGRPTVPAEERKDVRVCVRLSTDDLRVLDTLKAELSLSDSEIVRHALRALCFPGVTS